MSAKLPAITANLLRNQWQAFYLAQRRLIHVSTPTLWLTYGPPLIHSAAFLRRTYAYQPPPPDVEPPPGRVLDTCQHWLPDGTLCPHFPVPGSRPIRCYRHVHHILALCAIACHITGGTRRRTG